MMKLLIGIVLGAAIGSAMGYFGKCTTGACPLTATPLRGSLYGAAMGLMMAMAFGGSRVSEVPKEVQEAGEKLVLEVSSQQQVKQVLSENPVVLLDMYATWCGPCRTLSPVVKKLAYEYRDRVAVCKADVDKAPEIAKAYGVSGIPAVFVFKDGELVQKITGVHDFPRYAGILDAQLAGETQSVSAPISP